MNNKYILIDTKKLNVDNKYKFIYYLDRLIDITKYILLNLFITAKMNFVINKNNNTFLIKIYKDNTHHIVNFNLNYLNYTPESLCNLINLLFSAPNGITLIASYNIYNYKISFTSNCNFDLNLTLSGFHKVISLEKKIYYADINKLVSLFINFNSPSYIKFNIHNITSTNIINNNYETTFILPFISKNFGDIYTYNSHENYFNILTNCKLSYLDISITDDDGLIFDNNNYDYYAILEYV